MVRISRDEWAKRIERWTDSELTGAEFAAKIGVKEATLRHWKWALARRHARARMGSGGRYEPGVSDAALSRGGRASGSAARVSRGLETPRSV
jgi:hypothetical protein